MLIKKIIKKVKRTFLEFKVVSQNSSFYNVSSFDNSEPIFVVCNGPSIKEEENGVLAKLNAKQTIIVNEGFRNEFINSLQPLFHIIVDPAYFVDSNAEFITSMRKYMDTHINTFFVFPSHFAEFVYNYFGHDRKYIFIKSERCRGKTKRIRKISLFKKIPQYQIVMNLAIELAMCIGFKRIVLIGCDTTGLLENYIRRPYKPNASFGHSYKYSKEEANKTTNPIDNTTMLQGFWYAFICSKCIEEYARNNNVSIVNSSKTTALDVFKFTNLSDELL